MSKHDLNGHRVQFAVFTFRSGTHRWKGSGAIIEGSLVEAHVHKAVLGESDFQVFRYTNERWRQPILGFSGKSVPDRVVSLPAFNVDDTDAIAVVIYPADEGRPMDQVFPPRWW